MKKRVSILIALVASFGDYYLYAQQDPLFIQYMNNQIYVNPAYAGSKEYLDIVCIHSQQLVGFEGAPITSSIGINSPLRYKSIGVGFDVLNDKIGPLNRLSVSGDFAYRIQFRNEAKLSLGIKAGVDALNADLRLIDVTTIDQKGQVINTIRPTFGVGAYYFKESWFAGIGVPRITVKLEDNFNEFDNARHIFGIAGFKTKLNRKWDIRPTTQIRYVEGAPLSIDLTTTFVYDDRFWIGVGDRFKASVGGFFQWKITDRIKVGYGSDFTLSSLRINTFGSHELMFTYSVIKHLKERRVISPRYF